ncbi:LacI family DNA-binding transcriptional regulator [Roseicyclus marinus]|uniref:LacI family DNA-binding transcriptional regulator n=1 Tax=Roseicyclus marinus TaxID=2161673 RepID=UPI0024103598|nr:LacI family DNA-binding transcriptional regulator [Roseicyclus marinus]MDG3043142.1 LacI family DNA-binding transcriptional regulator [Roseicyclus marinus]
MTKVVSRPTLRDVAHHAGVSVISASRVMRDAPNISDGLRARVRAAANALGYTPNRIAGSLRGQASDLVAVIVPSMSNSVFADILDGIDEGFKGTPLRTVLGLSRYDMDEEEAILRELLSWNPAGVIISGLEHSAAATAILQRLECPVIEVMDSDGDPIDTSVGFSMVKAGQVMADHFLAQGYRRIGYVGAWGELPVRSRKRRLAFEARLAENGVELVDRQIEEDQSSFAAGAAGLQALLARSPEIEAVFFANDDLALGALFHCLSVGIAVPERLALAGFNGLDMRDGITPRLTTIRSPRNEIGARAGRIMLDRVRGRPSAERGRIDLSVSLLQGATT